MSGEEWIRQILSRSDMGARLTHLTRGESDKTAFDNLISILEDKRINGSTTQTGFICGDTPAVCLQETPLSAIAEFMYNSPLETKPKYEAYGLRFSKKFVYNKGGRPVIYGETEKLKSMLPTEEYWRIVKLEISDFEKVIDWTHEREWRVPNELCFEYKNIDIIVKNSTERERLISYFEEKNKLDVLKDVNSIICLIDVIS